MNIIFRLITLAGILAIFTNCNNSKKEHTQPSQFKWETYRGVNVACDISEKDVKDLAASGANLMRFSTAVCTYMEMEAPFAYKESAFQKLDSVLNWGEQYGVAVLIDPHRYPGSEHKWTMLGSDPFFKDFKYHDILINFWKKLANQCAKRGDVVAGYDLLNEPEIPVDMEKNTPQDINLLYKKLTKAIREVDSMHTIVYALPRIYNEETKVMQGYHKGIEVLEIPDDNNICLETHTYIPVPFTHQNIWEEGDYVAYPTKIDGILWDKAQLEKEQKELIAFSEKHPNIPVFVGEFSSPRWTGQDGMRFLTDVIDIAEKHNWSWAYHAFRENQVWDPEMNITNRNDSTRIANAPRWELLKSYFKKNAK
ncbi:glycoside hydrolase family 5 protein [Tamlana sp. I1]|uniref:glycoside hydrolase family 5 protein n=1 Tax=Tamlana sp. I1 TaxID=2762061 RepID=UPI00189067DF|nr:cellulase family glycosylhydrolase [Tamlana sp. I1]